MGKLFAQGWDAFWLDSSEPEEAWPHVGDAMLRDKQLHIGSGLEYTNIFPLEHTGRRCSSIGSRLTPRSASFCSRARHSWASSAMGATVWSGDVYSSWWALRRQVPAGLNFALSGYPYWTTDIGGYHPLNYAHSYASRPIRSFTRAGSSTAPSARSSAPTAIAITTSYGLMTRCFPRCLAVDRLRYRLLPYVYSLAWKVTSEDYTIQRPLVMDFREDPATLEIGDQFMFGPDHSCEPGAHGARNFTRRSICRRGLSGTTSGPESALRAARRSLRRRRSTASRSMCARDRFCRSAR